MLATVLVRGGPDTPRTVLETLESLRLTQKNACVLLEDTETNRGRLEAVKDYVAYGPVDDETVAMLEEQGDPPFTLSPPSKGFRDTRQRYGQGGAVGERDDMDDLLGRML